MASSLTRFRHLMKATPEKVTCPFSEKKPDTVREEKFPDFSKDLYFSVFPPPVPDRRIDDDRETDHNYFMKPLAHVGSGRLGKHVTAMRRDFTSYACTTVPKQDMGLVVVMTKMDARKVDYVDAVRAIEPFITREKETSPFICKILLSFKNRLPYQVDGYFYVSEYWHEGTSLCKHLQRVSCFREHEARFYLMELADALIFIHQYGIILRRLSLCSMLIEPNGHLRLAPYTLCDQNLDCSQACNMLVQYCGDQFYASPEIVFGMDVQSVADWWSFGVIMYQLLTGDLPFTGRTLGDLGKNITECPLRAPDCLSGEAAAILRHLLHKDPRRRLGFGESGVLEIKKHPFFQCVMWRDVRNLMIDPPYKPREDSELLQKVRAEKYMKHPYSKAN